MNAINMSQDVIDLLNEIETKGAELRGLVDRLKNVEGIDQYWINICSNDLQEGLRAITQSVRDRSYLNR